MTVYTPECVQRMVEKGTFRKITLGQAKNTDFDEMFYFKFPSHSMINEANGDGDWLDVWDYSLDFSEIDTKLGVIHLPDGPNTVVYVR